MSESTSKPAERKTVPAWVASVAIHAVLLILAVLLIQSTPINSGGESTRSGAIVVAQTTAMGEQDYFTADDVASDAAASQQQSITAAELPEEVHAAELEMPDIALPGEFEPGGVATSELLPTTDLRQTGNSTLLPGQGDADILAEDAALRAARGTPIPATQLSIFGSGPATGSSFVFVIDRSKSMGSEGLDALASAQRELALALAGLEPHHKFQIIAYHHKLQYLNERKLLKATTANRMQLGKFFGGLAAFGGTDHALAVTAAMHLRPDVVFLLTDGGDPYLTKPQMAEIRRIGGGRTQIHCIQFGFGPLQNVDGFMRRLSQNNGGSYRYVDVTK